MKRKILFPVFAVLLVLLIITAFYSAVYVKCNNLLVSVNKTQMPYSDEQNLISENNYNKLSVLQEPLSDNEYVQLKSKKKFEFKAINRVDMACDITVSVIDSDTWKTKKTITGKITIEFIFSDFHWKVKSVNQ